MKAFQFKVGGRSKKGSYGLPTGHSYKIPKTPEPPPPASWAGKPIGSVQEWRMILALTFYKLQFSYQHSVAGGRTRRGGQVLDFLVFTKPLMTPINIVGEYWHSGETRLDDELRRYSLLNEYKGAVRLPVDVFDWQIPDVESAKNIVKKELISG